MAIIYQFGSKAKVTAEAGDFPGRPHQVSVKGAIYANPRLSVDVIRLYLSAGRNAIELHLSPDTAENLQRVLRGALDYRWAGLCPTCGGAKVVSEPAGGCPDCNGSGKRAA